MNTEDTIEKKEIILICMENNIIMVHEYLSCRMFYIVKKYNFQY